jgi:hypothetical protein
MTPHSPAILEKLLRSNDLGWMIDMYSPRDQAIPFLLDQLLNLTNEFRNRFHHEVSFSPEVLEIEAQENPHKIRAFLQALGSSRNSEMLLMVWRILQGRSIREVTLNYRELETFRLSVTLGVAGAEAEETYNTENIGDAALLRNFGIATVDGRPLFDGFYAYRKG